MMVFRACLKRKAAMINIRKNLPALQARTPRSYPSSSGNTYAAGLYERDGPIPVPDVEESDTKSVWALFQDSLPPGQRQPVAASDDEPFEETVPAPLKP